MSSLVTYTFTPPFNPDWGMKRDYKPRVLKAQFGDGYAQRAADGQNNNPVTLTLVWNNLKGTEKDSIVQFFASLQGYQSFWYTYQDESTAKAYVCEQWDYEHISADVYTVNATFTQVYDSLS